MVSRTFAGSAIDSMSCVDTMVHALSKFVSIPSVSKRPEHREDCRQAAIWLKKCFTQLGADATMVCKCSLMGQMKLKRLSFQLWKAKILWFWQLSKVRRARKTGDEYYFMGKSFKAISRHHVFDDLKSLWCYFCSCGWVVYGSVRSDRQKWVLLRPWSNWQQRTNLGSSLCRVWTPWKTSTRLWLGISYRRRGRSGKRRLLLGCTET